MSGGHPYLFIPLGGDGLVPRLLQRPEERLPAAFADFPAHAALPLVLSRDRAPSRARVEGALLIFFDISASSLPSARPERVEGRFSTWRQFRYYKVSAVGQHEMPSAAPPTRSGA